MPDPDRTSPIQPCAITYGVDLSTNPKKTGLVAIRWDGASPGLVTQARVAVTLDDLIDGISRSTGEQAVWAVDVPFGWPDGFAEFLTDHRNGPTDLRPDPESKDRPWARISHRDTDRAVRMKGGAGINVAFDKLGATAAGWSVVEHGLYRKGITLDRSGLTGRVVETYPSAAWRDWGFSSRPAAKHSWKTTRDILVGEAVIDVGENGEALAGSEHVRDALACALVARARALGLTRGPVTNLQRARREGWIHLPTAESLGLLAG